VPYAELDARRLSFVRRGSGEPLLLIMGMAGHVGLWSEPFLSDLERDFDIVAFDNRGIGQSTDVPGQWTIADLAEDAAAILDAVGWDTAHVMGISLGGMIAQELVLQHPERVRRLVLGCSYSGGAGSSLLATGPLRMMEAANSGDAERAFRAGYEVNLSPAYVAEEANWSVFRRIAGSVVVPVPVVMRQAQAAFVHDASTRLPSVTAPTLVIAGTADQMLVPENSELIASLIPSARLLSFDGVGHLFWWERPAETAAAVREHLLS
jgi:3-oxoadipate enol-lactonase